MRISNHIEDIIRDIKDEKLPPSTDKGLDNIVSKTSHEDWGCMEDFLGNVFSGLQQNLYNLETYAVNNDDDKFDSINKSIANAICSLLIAKNKFSEAKKKSNKN